MVEASGAFDWKVTGTVSKGDYLYAIVKGHPAAIKHGYVLKHRIVVELSLGRYLLPEEIVHHKNGDKMDNRIENLEVMSLSEHAAEHRRANGQKLVDLKCPSCGIVFTRLYGQTHLIKGCALTSCSRQCRGSFAAKMQYLGRTVEVETAISENIVRVYRRFPDNSEETIDMGSVETTRRPSEKTKI